MMRNLNEANRQVEGVLGGGVMEGVAYTSDGSRNLAGQDLSRNAGYWKAAEQRTPVAEAEALLKADAEHRSLAADQALMLRMVMPFVGQGLNQLADGCYQWFAHQGFWPNWMRPCYQNSSISAIDPEGCNQAIIAGKVKKAEKIALIHSEVSEMLEAVRKGDQENEAEEAADILIRLLDYCGATGIDLGRAFELKMLANYRRPHKHNKEF